MHFRPQGRSAVRAPVALGQVAVLAGSSALVDDPGIERGWNPSLPESSAGKLPFPGPCMEKQTPAAGTPPGPCWAAREGTEYAEGSPLSP